LALAAAGCQDEEPASVAGENKKTSARPAEGAMCAEHGVLEAVCTKCNPKLAPIFQAKGDWCAEHGFPESFCPICHPERGGKPATNVAGDGAPADGTKVRFRTKDTARLAGIETTKAEARAGGARLEAVATIVYDATRHAQINARADGVVRRIEVDVGAQVKKDAPLALVESAAVGADRSRVRAAATRLRVAEAAHRRTHSLYESGIAPEKDVQEAGQTLDEARSELAAARASLGMVGAGEAGAGGYTVRAPIAGTVIRRGAMIGHLVDTDHVLFEIVDTSTMWVEIDVPEDRVGEVAPGQAVTVVLDATPGREWKGKLDYVAPEVDPRTRTARARARLDNNDAALRANLYGRALIELGAVRPTVMVPREAVQRAGGASLVFVRLAQDVYEARRVKIGLSEGNLVELASGVKPGEPVATRGSFLLKTETLKGAIGAGCCDVE
jgi:cobalt-zinc-cadmium efflux system membrane fusion protein